MLLPKKVKHRKWHRLGRRDKGIATRTNTVAFGSFGLVAQTYGWVSSRQLEACRRVLTRYIRRGGKMWIRVFPDRPVTKKGNELPMGGGKGSPDQFVITVKPGTVLFELEGVAPDMAREALLLACHKLPVKGRVVSR
ncbi:MAG: 50S ribosomal protein L16 [Candidatus Magasanikbacteria bacterium RIFCSPHIGHO2_02_FULL_47_14]|uniref:Large ribosomal subunit protein uL16 n=1 Tax=Candidatus Magasanikbacteria bacterium RIFCSPHIGHO2_02_FULL_47_14 TaxID=1798680 RepID=A0A1F6LYP5_9BACT|nr:MAG: 50S ribosomal protein L16 [Candidatus Magasanikbacteria bacterium RIFCSPHIGHO2_02_FULL_47_14]